MDRATVTFRKAALWYVATVAVPQGMNHPHRYIVADLFWENSSTAIVPSKVVVAPLAPVTGETGPMFLYEWPDTDDRVLTDGIYGYVYVSRCIYVLAEDVVVHHLTNFCFPDEDDDLP